MKALRLRIGVALFALAWLPMAQLLIWLTGLQEPVAGKLRIATWTVQFFVGLAGVALAGSTTINVVKHLGFRRAPAALWRMLRTGEPIS